MADNPQISEVLNAYSISKASLEKMMEVMRADMDKGLSGDENVRKLSPLKMIPTFVRAVPDGNESGDFLALDLGGTNFRVLRIQIKDGKAEMDFEQYTMNKELMESDAVTLFDYIANCIAEFGKSRGINSKLPLGFTFSFPIKQVGLTSGLLIKWTKGFTATGVEGEDVVKLLREALQRRPQHDFDIDVVALLNDTTGTMIACGLSDPNVRVGLILGTGTNACYMEQLENVGKWTEDRNNPAQVVINIEWGAFGDYGELDWARTDSDKKVDEKSPNPSFQLFEKMISGMYLGEIVRYVCMELVNRGLLFKNGATEKMTTIGGLETRDVSDVESDDESKSDAVVKLLGTSPTADDYAIVKRVCHVVSQRAASLAAAGLATIIKKINQMSCTIAVDGSVFKKHPKFKGYMQTTIKELLPESNIKLMLSEDGSGKGAAVVAAIAHKMQAAS